MEKIGFGTCSSCELRTKKTGTFRNKLNNERLRAIYVCCSDEAPNTLFRRASWFRLWSTNSLLPHAFCFKAERGS